MSDTTPKKKPGRWKPHGQRYGREDQTALKKLRPVSGWKNGARVARTGTVSN